MKTVDYFLLRLEPFCFKNIRYKETTVHFTGDSSVEEQQRNNESDVTDSI